MKISLRGWILIGMIGGLAIALAAYLPPTLKAAEPAAAPLGRLTDAELENVLTSLGLKPVKVDSRYDFAFRATHKEEKWDLSMAAVLSQDGESLWIMAWLDKLPDSSTDVSNTALLRLLALNDRMGHGKFFAYIPSNRCFVLQRVMPNEGLTTSAIRSALIDLGTGVAETHNLWSVANWKQTEQPKVSPAGATASPHRGVIVRPKVPDQPTPSAESKDSITSKIPLPSFMRR